VINPFNTPVETGVRVLVLLVQSAPQGLDLNRLVLLDHGLLHSADFGGPESLHPSVPLRSGELGVKRRDLAHGLQVMLRAGLVEMVPRDGGIFYRASDGANAFLGLMESEYVARLTSRAGWVMNTLGSLPSDHELRTYMAQTVGHWLVEFSQDVFPDRSSVM
jgi:hypothetical protein